MRRISVRAMSTTPASWYADPVKRHELRYWDGGQWTEHVSDDGITGVDPLQRPPSRMDQIDDALTVGREGDPDKIARQLSGTGNRSAEVTAAAFEGGGSLFTEPILVVNQKAKVIELNNQFSVFNAQGERIAIVNEIGQSAAKKVLRLVSSLDQYLTHRLQITDPNGFPLLQLTRPAKVVKSSVIVSDGGSNEIGRIVQRNVFGKIDFGLEAGGQTVGEIKGENWRAWNWRIEDHTGAEVARITKTFEGLATTLFTTADNYVVQLHRVIPQPLLSLVIAASLSVDTALKQDARGLG